MLSAHQLPEGSYLARAKVNLYLHVVGKRDDGFHLLDSLIVFAETGDVIAVEPAEQLTLTVDGPFAEGLAAEGDNLVLRAARALAVEIGITPRAHIKLTKNLPIASGIGGGSADAAAALRLLASLNNLSLDDPRLRKVALATGADVPVCLFSRACDMTGVGEQLLPLALPSMPCVMVNPRVPVATKDVFKALGLRNGELLVGATDVLEAPAWPEEGASIADWVEILKTVPNDLEASAMRIEPVIGDVLEALRDSAGVKLARMSGSGATCFAIFGASNDAHAAAEKIRGDHPGWWVHAGTLS